MKFLIARIVGNELPPRDSAGSKLRALRRIAEINMPSNCHNLWVLNHLHDQAYREEVIAVLELFSQDYTELKFSPITYAALVDPMERLRYAININSARNYAVRLGQKHYDFTVCLDQDCFFTQELWEQVERTIETDQLSSSGRSRQYYGVTMKRVTGDINNHGELQNEEPNLIFRHDADRLFDPRIPFGQNDKVELLAALGYGPPPDYEITGDICKSAGFVLHLSFGNEDLERDMRSRVQARRLSTTALLSQLDRKHGASL